MSGLTVRAQPGERPARPGGGSVRSAGGETLRRPPHRLPRPRVRRAVQSLLHCPVLCRVPVAAIRPSPTLALAPRYPAVAHPVVPAPVAPVVPAPAVLPPVGVPAKYQVLQPRNSLS